MRISYASTLVLVKRVDQVLHLLDLYAEGRGRTLTNAIDPRFQRHVLDALGMPAAFAGSFSWVLYGTDAFISRYECPGFVPLGSFDPDPEINALMLQLYGEALR